MPARRIATTEPAGLTRLLDEDPELVAGLDEARREIVRRRVVADVVRVGRGHWPAQDDQLCARADFGLLVLDGALVRRIEVCGRFSVELLGSGDLIRPHQPDSDDYATIGQRAEWSVLEPARLAIIDHELIALLAGVRGALPELTARALRRSRSLALRLAIAQVPSLESRLEILLWHIADRWGARTGGRVIITLPLSQQTLAELACAQRTSVCAAVGLLQQRGVVQRLKGRGWALLGDPPPALASAAWWA